MYDKVCYSRALSTKPPTSSNNIGHFALFPKFARSALEVSVKLTRIDIEHGLRPRMKQL